MKQDQSIIDKINGFLSEEFEVDTFRMQPGANLRQVLELDSLDYIDLVVVIENNFSFKVKPEDFIRIISFQDFYTYIISRVQSKEPTDAVMAGQVKG
ncbi:MAG TPA: acyl carrier protein [Chitinophagaceae bacterium]|jgi:acyl carrier protein|nr:acyl carrier protein [Chitinophagaceae bacterium]